jgi:hypothetical protein
MLKRLNLKIYTFLTLLASALGYSFSDSVYEFVLLNLILITVILNHFMLIEIVGEITQLLGHKKFKLLGLFIAKTLLISLSFLMIVHYAKHLIMFALFLYIFQLISLVISIKK